MTQVEEQHYEFSRYLSKTRWGAYYHQIEEVLSASPQNVLVVGIGDGVVPCVLKILGKDINVLTFDFDEKLNPDYLGDIREIHMILDKKFDVVVCCQVLEHIPYNDVESVIRNFSQIAHRVVISVPYKNLLTCSIGVSTVKFKEYSMKIQIPQFFRTLKFNGEHYYELGTKGFSKKLFKEMLKKYFIVQREYIPFSNINNQFFVLVNKEAEEK